MGQFKPMVKMMTTEPTVELKLKKGGAVKKAEGGFIPMNPSKSAMPARGGMFDAAAPKKPSFASRRKAMATPLMKEGGETKAEHKAEMKAIKSVGKELMSHEGKPASKAHKGLKTGGVVNGQGGFKKGGLASSGIIKTEGQGGEYRNTKMDTTKPNRSPAKTGAVKDGNGGGYKTGGVVKGQGGYCGGGAPKKFAEGGAVQDDGKAVKMKQGSKPVPSPVSITALSGTYKKGGKVSKYKDGGTVDAKAVSDKASRELEEALNPISMAKELYGKARDYIKGTGPVSSKETVVIEKAKKRGGTVKC